MYLLPRRPNQVSRRIFWIAGVLAGCSTAAPSSCPELEIPTAQTPKSSRADVDTILARSCAVGGCHSGSEGASGLTFPLEGGAWRELVVGRRAQQNPSMMLVQAGEPAKSWLMVKIVGTPCGTCAPELGCGARMPFNRPLPDAEIATIAAWIRNGASL
jgi:hypothetical protein